MKVYKITVKKWLTFKSNEYSSFMARWNKDIPMPLVTMCGYYTQESPKMKFWQLHGDIAGKKSTHCMKCGRLLTNPVSEYFGIGPECGGHNYVNPFKSAEELNYAVNEYKKKLQTITWEGWIPNDDIIEIEEIGENDVVMPEQINENIIKVKIEKSKAIASEQSAFLSFRYDETALSVIRSIPIRRWHNEEKMWEIRATDLDTVKERLPQFTFEVEGKIKKKISNLPKGFEFKTEPFTHQIDGFMYGLNHERWLLGDEQGLGKTKQAIDIAVAKKLLKGYKHCLIICGVNGLKWNWVNEIKTHSNETAHILGQSCKKNKITIGGTTAKIADLANLKLIKDYFIITNVESLRNKEIADYIAKYCKDKTIGITVIDEIHKCKNPSSQQGKGILKVQSECRIAMTGTPLMNTPLDIYIILKWLGYETHAFYSFKNHYCVMGGFGGYEIIGYKNLSELQANLEAIMLRRKKSDVLDLPEKIFVDEYVDMTPKQEQIYKEVTAEVKANIDMIKMSVNPLAEMIRMRQATGYTGILSSTIKESAKLDRMEELVEEAVENGKKVVIFSNWTQMTDVIKTRLAKKYKGVVITGQTNDAERQVNVNHFQNNDDCKYIIGTIGAMGTGLTLTAGTVEIFMDEPWNKALLDQAVDRCHRVGTKENITIYTLMCHNTIDEKIHAIVKSKGDMADAIVDKAVLNDKGLMVDYLLS